MHDTKHAGCNRGVPDELMRQNNRAAKVPATVLPTAEEAVHGFEQTEGHLTVLPKFGHDPLEGSDDLQEARNQGFIAKYPNFEPLFSGVVNGNDQPFRAGLMHFISLTTRLSHSLQYINIL